MTRNLTQEKRPVRLDPEPTLYGSGRINEHVYPDGSTELSKALLWLQNRARRLAFGGRLRSTLIGDPIVAANVRASTQPLRDFRNDQSMPEDETDDDTYGHPITNWGPNQ